MKNTIEKLPKLLEKKAFDITKNYVKSESEKIGKEVKKYEGLINERENYSKLLEEIKKNEPKRKFLLEENKFLRFSDTPSISAGSLDK